MSHVSSPSLSRTRLQFLQSSAPSFIISWDSLGTDELRCLGPCVSVLGQRFSIVSADTKKGASHRFLVYPERKTAIMSIRTGSRFLFPKPLFKHHDAPSRTSACPSTIQKQPTCSLLHRDHNFLMPVLDNVWIQTRKTGGGLNNGIVFQQRTLF